MVKGYEEVIPPKRKQSVFKVKKKKLKNNNAF